MHPRPPGLEISGRNLAQPIPGRAAQVLGCLHFQDRLEMLLGRPDVTGSTGEGEAVHGLRVLWIDFVGLAHVVERPRAVTLES
jgi:hypothetical protein